MAARRAAEGSTTTTSCTPSARRPRNTPIPMGPAPKITACMPGSTSPRRMPWNDTDIGSTRAPDSSDTPGGSAKTWSRRAMQYSARPPPSDAPHPSARVGVCRCARPRRQRSHSSQRKNGRTATGVPGTMPVTPGPTRSTTPENSWPMGTGSERASCPE